jgi:hypothetical protein
LLASSGTILRPRSHIRVETLKCQPPPPPRISADNGMSHSSNHCAGMVDASDSEVDEVGGGDEQGSLHACCRGLSLSRSLALALLSLVMLTYYITPCPIPVSRPPPLPRHITGCINSNERTSTSTSSSLGRAAHHAKKQRRYWRRERLHRPTTV